jgi:hypothetical protein
VIFGGTLLGALITQRRADQGRMQHGDANESPLTLEGLESAARSERVDLVAEPPPQEFSSM